MDATQAEVAWLAGLFEGEGCLCLSRNRWRLNIAMTDRDVIERVHELTGRIGSVQYIKPRERPNGVTWSEQWRWVVERRDDVRALLVSLYPWLGNRRRAKVDEFLRWYDAAGPGKPPTERLTADGAPECGRCGSERRRKANGRLWCPTCQAEYKRRSLAKAG